MNSQSVYSEWRFWVGVCAPALVAWGATYVMQPTVLNLLLLFSFMFLVMPAFTRLMARAQSRAETRAELQRIQAEFDSVVEMVDALPYEQQLPYTEGLYRMEFRIRVLESVLESKR